MPSVFQNQSTVGAILPVQDKKNKFSIIVLMYNKQKVTPGKII